MITEILRYPTNNKEKNTDKPLYEILHLTILICNTASLYTISLLVIL